MTSQTITALGTSIINLINRKTPIATASTVGMVKPDGSTISIDADGVISSNGGSGSGLQMFDTVLKDHVLTFEESKGLALQGTYVYKTGVSGSRYGYPDFYNKCVEEFENSAYITWQQPVATASTTHITGGDMVISASSSYSTDWSAYKAFDSISTSMNNGWAVNSTNIAGWWQVKFPYKIRVTGIQYYRRYSGGADNATTGRFYASSDKTITLGDSFSAPAEANSVYSLDIANIPTEGVVTDTIYLETQAINGSYCGMDYLKITATELTRKNTNGHIFYNIADKTNIDKIFNNTGSAWFYGVDTENERIFLPRNNNFVQLTVDTSQVGDSIEAGLPNITGATGGARGGGTGAFSSEGWKLQSVIDGSNTRSGLVFDASLSNSIYGNSDTVQPAAVKQLLYICVGNTEVTSSITNVTEITTSENDTLPLFYNFYSKEDMTTTGAYVNASLGSYLSGNVYPTAYNELVNKLGTGNVKANTDTYTDYDFVVNQDDMTFRLPLLNGDRVLVEKKEPTELDPTWYNLYSDGWCEQGGQGVSDSVINLFKSYKDISYNTVVTWRNNGSVTYPITDTAKTTSSFSTVSKSGRGNLYWQTEGYTNIPSNTGVNLYYKVANAVTNLEIIDVAGVMSTLNTKTDMAQAAAASMPSDKYIDLTLGASNTTYTAPTNGYFLVSWTASAANQYLHMRNINSDFGTTSSSVANYNGVRCWLPVRKNDVVVIGYNVGTKNYFRFYYAEGAKEE